MPTTRGPTATISTNWTRFCANWSFAFRRTSYRRAVPLPGQQRSWRCSPPATPSSKQLAARSPSWQPTRRMERSLGLKDVAFFELGIKMTNINELIGKGKPQLSMADVPVERVAPYACADADIALRLAQRFEVQLNDAGLWDLFSRVEMPLVPV